MENPTTEDTTIPTTDTPISEVPSAAPAESDGGETAAAPAEAAPSDIFATTSAAVAGSAETPVVAETEEPVSGEAAASAAASQPVDGAPSAPTADADAGLSNTDASSVAADPLHVQVAGHLEAIYQLTKTHTEAAAKPALFGEVKEHASDILEKLKNGISVAEGELVAKLEKLVSLL